MAESRKRIVTFVVAAAIVCGVLILNQMKPTPSYRQAAMNAGPDTLSLNEPNFGIQSPENFDIGKPYYKMMLAILLVGALGVAAIYMSKRLVPKIAGFSGKEIRVVETAYIGQRKALHLLKIGNRMLLIGSTNENISKLADVTEALSDSSGQLQDDN